MRKKGIVIWLFGLSGSGKSTIAKNLDDKLSKKGYLIKRLDGDDLRKGINSDLGYSVSDRLENIRRASEIAKLFSDTGVIAICSFISPLQECREIARNIIGETNFFDVFIDCSFETCVKRDPKGLYKKALNGDIKNFTGIDAQFQRPDKAFLTVSTEEKTEEEVTEEILDQLLLVLK